jgi:Skp family chaperone for outer membrane proteins
MDPSSVEFVERRFSLETEKLTIERDRKFLTELLARRRMELMYYSYAAVQRAASELAAREGYGAVIVVPLELPPQPIDLPGAIDSIKTSSILWTNPNYDVTDQVIEILNGGG